MPKPEKKTPGAIRSASDLAEIKERVQRENTLRADGYRACVTVHLGTCGIAAGAAPVLDALREEQAAAKRRDVRLATSGCIGVCAQEPVMTIQMLDMEPVVYARLDADKARLIFREHALEGRPVAALAMCAGREEVTA